MRRVGIEPTTYSLPEPAPEANGAAQSALIPMKTPEDPPEPGPNRSPGCKQTASGPATGLRPRVYIAGPMTGLPDFNYPLFHMAAARWRAAGWVVCNPAENFDGHQGLPYADYLRRGARVEWSVADVLGLAQYDALGPVPEFVDVLPAGGAA